MNHLLSHYYPNLWVRWINADLNSEVLFSSFLISLFTSFLEGDNWYLFEFWDIILTERWIGMAKCILFIIEIHYKELMDCNPNDTLRFFSEIKNENSLESKMKKQSFKLFVKNFIFDEALFSELENKFNIIKDNIKVL